MYSSSFEVKLLNRKDQRRSSLPAVRFHSCTYIDGSLFFFGGISDDEAYSNKVFVYDVDTNEWTLDPVFIGHESPSERHSHIAINLGGPGLLIHGGNDGAEKDDYWVLSKIKKSKGSYVLKWEELNCQGVPISGRFGHAGVKLKDCIYIFGGLEGYDDRLYKIDLDQWDVCIPMDRGEPPEGTALHTMNAVRDSLFLFGGSNSNGMKSNGIFEFDVKKNYWKKVQTRGIAPELIAHRSIILDYFIFFIFGDDEGCSSDINIYDTKERRWLESVKVGNLEYRECFSAECGDNNRIYIYGGRDISEEDRSDLVELKAEQNELNIVKANSQKVESTSKKSSKELNAIEEMVEQFSSQLSTLKANNDSLTERVRVLEAGNISLMDGKTKVSSEGKSSTSNGGTDDTTTSRKTKLKELSNSKVLNDTKSTSNVLKMEGSGRRMTELNLSIINIGLDDEVKEADLLEELEMKETTPSSPKVHHSARLYPPVGGDVQKLSLSSEEHQMMKTINPLKNGYTMTSTTNKEMKGMTGLNDVMVKKSTTARRSTESMKNSVGKSNASFGCGKASRTSTASTSTPSTSTSPASTSPASTSPASTSHTPTSSAVVEKNTNVLNGKHHGRVNTDHMIDMLSTSQFLNLGKSNGKLSRIEERDVVMRSPSSSWMFKSKTSGSSDMDDEASFPELNSNILEMNEEDVNENVIQKKIVSEVGSVSPVHRYDGFGGSLMVPNITMGSTVVKDNRQTIKDLVKMRRGNGGPLPIDLMGDFDANANMKRMAAHLMNGYSGQRETYRVAGNKRN